jgi:hypothetical protein
MVVELMVRMVLPCAACAGWAAACACAKAAPGTPARIEPQHSITASRPVRESMRVTPVWLLTGPRPVSLIGFMQLKFRPTCV